MERNTMLHRISIIGQFGCRKIALIAVSALFILSLVCLSGPTFARDPGQRTFASPEDDANAFFAAMKSEDLQAQLSILGPAGKDVLSSGDPEEDSDARASFVLKYQE